MIVVLVLQVEGNLEAQRLRLRFSSLVGFFCLFGYFLPLVDAMVKTLVCVLFY